MTRSSSPQDLIPLIPSGLVNRQCLSTLVSAVTSVSFTSPLNVLYRPFPPLHLLVFSVPFFFDP